MRQVANWVTRTVFLLLASGLTPGMAFGSPILKQIRMDDDLHFTLIFNSPVKSDQVVTDFIKDTIQISIKDVAIYPAKVMPLDVGPASKVFAYQYNPHWVRCRFKMKGKAFAFKERLGLEFKGSKIRVGFDKVPSSEASSNSEVRTEILNSQEVQQKSKEPPSNQKNEEEEKVLYEKVVNSKEGKIRPEQPNPEKGEILGKANPSLAPSWGSVMLKFGFVLACLLGCLIFLKSLKAFGSSSRKRNEQNGIMKAIGRFAKGTFKTEGNLIQVLSTYHLDPKKSIAVVRVAGRLLVLGLSSESINLITQLSDTSSGDPEGDFSDLLKSESVKPDFSSAASELPLLTGARSRIKSRLEGLKPL